jgi:hypothetical protein
MGRVCGDRAVVEVEVRVFQHGSRDGDFGGRGGDLLLSERDAGLDQKKGNGFACRSVEVG